MPYSRAFIKLIIFFLSSFFAVSGQQLKLPKLPKVGQHDTIPMAMTLYEGGWILTETLPPLVFRSTITLDEYRKWARLERAVMKTYPYAKAAGKTILEMQSMLDSLPTKKEKKAYFRSREREVKAQFTAPLTKLSRYQGSILIKLINRETSNTCYELLKEYKGGVTATMWELVAGMFQNSLKSTYQPDSNPEDFHIETMVRKLERETVF